MSRIGGFGLRLNRRELDHVSSWVAAILSWLWHPEAVGMLCRSVGLVKKSRAREAYSLQPAGWLSLQRAS